MSRQLLSEVCAPPTINVTSFAAFYHCFLRARIKSLSSCQAVKLFCIMLLVTDLVSNHWTEEQLHTIRILLAQVLLALIF